jgi:hypothetical protein
MLNPIHMSVDRAAETIPISGLRLLSLFLLAVAILSPSALGGSGNRTGTSGAAELLIPVGTRDISLGGSTIAATRGVDALYLNPAGSARLESDILLSGSHMTYLSDLGVSSGSAAAAIDGFGILAVQIRALTTDPIPVTTVDYPDGTGATFRPLFLVAGLTFARQLTERIAVGGTASYVSEKMADVRATGVAFTVGLMYNDLAGLRGLGLGVVVRNIGPQMQFEGTGLKIKAAPSSLDRGEHYYSIDAAGFELPTTLELGVAFASAIDDDHSFVLATSFEDNNFGDNAYRFGLEYSFQEVLALRAGYQVSPPESGARESIFGPTFGAGLCTRAGDVILRFDYAYRATKFFGASHAISLTMGL